MKKRDRDVLSDAVSRMIDISEHVVSVAPDWIATGTMKIIQFDYATHNAGWYGCYQHILQLARERLRGRFDPDAKAKLYIAGQIEMFGDALQERYPRKPQRNEDGGWAEPEYILRMHLNAEDRWHNIDRLDHVAVAAAKHAAALRAETIQLFGPRKNLVA